MRAFHFGLRRTCAVVIGLVFFLSGSFKLVDPVGTGLKVHEYLNLFHFGFLGGLSEAGGVVLSLLEALTGAALICGVLRKLSGVAACCLTVFFTIVTLVLYFSGSVMECGCFGDFVPMSPGATLTKNLVLCALCALAFLPFRDFGKGSGHRKVAFGIVAGALVLLMVRSLAGLPLVDLASYPAGTFIAASPAEGGEPAFMSSFIYSKDGQERSFILSDLDEGLPDSTWTFVRSETIPIGEAAPRPSLPVRTAEGDYMDHLAAEGDVLIISVPGKLKNLQRILSAMQAASEAGMQPLLLTAAPQDEIAPAYISDYKELLSLNRSNGGATCLKDGEVVRKWAARSLPDYKQLSEVRAKDPDGVILSARTSGRMVFRAWLLLCVAVLLLF